MSDDQPPVGPDPTDEPSVERSVEPPLAPLSPPPVEPPAAAPAQWQGGPPAQWQGGPPAQWQGGQPPQWQGGSPAQWQGGQPPQWQGGPPPAGPFTEPSRPRLHWALVLIGIPLGFLAWVVASFLLVAISGTLGGGTGAGAVILVGVLVLLFLASVGLIVWPRTRRLGQGIVLGAAIGLVVAGGLCIPLVSSFGSF